MKNQVSKDPPLKKKTSLQMLSEMVKLATDSHQLRRENELLFFLGLIKKPPATTQSLHHTTPSLYRSKQLGFAHTHLSIFPLSLSLSILLKISPTHWCFLKSQNTHTLSHSFYIRLGSLNTHPLSLSLSLSLCQIIIVHHSKKLSLSLT